MVCVDYYGMPKIWVKNCTNTGINVQNVQYEYLTS